MWAPICDMFAGIENEQFNYNIEEENIMSDNTHKDNTTEVTKDESVKESSRYNWF